MADEQKIQETAREIKAVLDDAPISLQEKKDLLRSVASQDSVPAPRDYDLHKNISLALQNGESSVVNYEVENEEIRTTMQLIGDRIERGLPSKWGFAVFIFDEGQENDPTKSAATPGERSACFYVSSHDRDSVSTMLAAWLERQKKS